MKRYSIAVLPFDGVGKELMNMTGEILVLAQQKVGGFALDLHQYEAGAAYFERTGKLLPDNLIEGLKAADAVLCGCHGVGDADQVLTQESAAQKKEIEDIFRRELKNGIAVRPFYQFKGVPSPLCDQKEMNVLLVYQLREEAIPSAFDGDGYVACDVQMLTRPAVEQVARFALSACQNRSGRLLDGQRTVSVGGKQGVMETLDFIRRIAGELSADFPGVTVEFKQIDALAEHFIKASNKLDVLLCEGQHGFILEKMGYYLAGSTQISPSADLGGVTPIFRPKHGACTQEGNKNTANPFGMILSAALMLETLGQQCGDAALCGAGKLIFNAVQGSILRHGLLTPDIGGSQGTLAAFESIVQEINRCGLLT